MTIEELEKQLNECQKALAELKESKKEGKWKPKDGEGYWFKEISGSVGVSTWEGDRIDIGRYNNIPIFPTKEECQRYWHFMDTVKEKSYEFTADEWEDEDLKKYAIYFNYNQKRWNVCCQWTNRSFGEVFFKIKEDAQYIIDNFKDELMEWFL